MKVIVHMKATGPLASGKTYELDRLQALLAERGFEVKDVQRDADGPIPSEFLEMSREGIWQDK